MKRTFAKQGLKSLVAMFLLFGSMLFAANRAEAQISNQQNMNWLTESEAIQALEPILESMSNTLGGLPPGTQAYYNVEIPYSYYKMIHASIVGGMTVPEAVVNNLPAVNVHKTDNDPQAQTIRNQLFDDAVDLLTTN